MGLLDKRLAAGKQNPSPAAAAGQNLPNNGFRMENGQNTMPANPPPQPMSPPLNQPVNFAPEQSETNTVSNLPPPNPVLTPTAPLPNPHKNGESKKQEGEGLLSHLQSHSSLSPAEPNVSLQQIKDGNKSNVLKNRLDEIETEKRFIEDTVEKEITKINEEERVHVDAVTKTIANIFKSELSLQGMTPTLVKKIEQAVQRECESLNVAYESQQRIKKTVISGIVGLGPLEPYMNDKKVTEIIVQRWDNICIEREGRIFRVSATFTDEMHLQTVIQRIVQPIGRQINTSQPIVDARLADGSRVCATFPPASPDGATLDIRRFFDVALTGDDYIRLGSMSAPMLEFLRKAVGAKASIIVSGGTGTGKTTLLNMLSSAIPQDELIITIEDSCELKLETPNIRRLETRSNTSGNTDKGMMNVDIRQLVKTSLRMRPDRIIVGEIRDGTITDMVSAMCTGHEGSMCTVHANSAINLVRVRLPMLYSMSDNRFSEESQNIQIAEALDLIVQIKRYGKLRAIQSITMVDGLEVNGRVKLQDIFRYNEKKGAYEATGYIPHRIIDRMYEKGIFIDDAIFKSPEVIKQQELQEADKKLKGKQTPEKKQVAEQPVNPEPEKKKEPNAAGSTAPEFIEDENED